MISQDTGPKRHWDEKENIRRYSSSISSSRNIPYKTTYISLDHVYGGGNATDAIVRVKPHVRSDVATCAQKKFQPVTFIQHHPQFDFQGHKFDIQGLAMDYGKLHNELLRISHYIQLHVAAACSKLTASVQKACSKRAASVHQACNKRATSLQQACIKLAASVQQLAASLLSFLIRSR
ncbi:hypothetical protein Tco_1293530 [Tanacetum coccineum]